VSFVKNNPIIYTYKMTHDDGAAPCVEDDFLTLAICKREIRKIAQVGDILIGIGGRNLGLGRLIYAAKITEIIGPGPDYYINPQHHHREDCVYKRDANGKPVHRGPPWDHYQRNAQSFRPRDVGRNWQNARVLKSTDFRYLGKTGPGNLLVNYPDLRSLVEMSRVY
jgi:hypothetical protein